MDLERKLLFIALAAGVLFLLVGAIVEECRANKRFIKQQEELEKELTIAVLRHYKLPYQRITFSQHWDSADDLTPAEEHLRVAAMTETRTV